MRVKPLRGDRPEGRLQRGFEGRQINAVPCNSDLTVSVIYFIIILSILSCLGGNVQALQFTVDIGGNDLVWALSGGLIALFAAAILAAIAHVVSDVATFGFGGGSYREDFTKAVTLLVPTGVLASGLTSIFGGQWWMTIVVFMCILALVSIIARLVQRTRRH